MRDRRGKGKVMPMYYYFVTFNDYFGYCVAVNDNSSGQIVFTGTIEECNHKCIDLNMHR